MDEFRDDDMRRREWRECTAFWNLVTSSAIPGQSRKCGFSDPIIKVRSKGVAAIYAKPIAELRSVTCHMGSHSVTCHQTQVNAPRLHPSQAGVDLPRTDRRLSWRLCGWL